ncbi:MAG: hypothetical protein ACK5JI_08575 [Azonexus sp.]
MAWPISSSSTCATCSALAVASQSALRYSVRSPVLPIGGERAEDVLQFFGAARLGADAVAGVQNLAAQGVELRIPLGAAGVGTEDFGGLFAEIVAVQPFDQLFLGEPGGVAEQRFVAAGAVGEVEQRNTGFTPLQSPCQHLSHCWAGCR